MRFSAWCAFDIQRGRLTHTHTLTRTRVVKVLLSVAFFPVGFFFMDIYCFKNSNVS